MVMKMIFVHNLIHTKERVQTFLEAGIISESLDPLTWIPWSGWNGQHLPFGAGGEEFGGLAHACFALSFLARRVFLWLLMSRGRRGWWRTDAGTRVLIRHATDLHRKRGARTILRLQLPNAIVTDCVNPGASEWTMKQLGKQPPAWVWPLTHALLDTNKPTRSDWRFTQIC